MLQVCEFLWVWWKINVQTGVIVQTVFELSENMEQFACQNAFWRFYDGFCVHILSNWSGIYFLVHRKYHMYVLLSFLTVKIAFKKTSTNVHSWDESSQVLFSRLRLKLWYYSLFYGSSCYICICFVEWISVYSLGSVAMISEDILN